MIYSIYNFQIKKIEYGWIVQKRVGNQWKDNSFFTTLGLAADHVFEQQYQRVSKNDRIDLNDISRIEDQIKKVVDTLESIKEEIFEVFHGK